MRAFERINSAIDIQLPKRATKGSAGYDICSAEDVVIHPGTKQVIHTNIRVHMDYNDVLFVYPRSSFGIKKDLMLANSVGVIDSDYKDEIMICYRNMGDTPVTINKGDRVAQGVFTKFLKTGLDNSTDERTGGIGSTGV